MKNIKKTALLGSITSLIYGVFMPVTAYAATPTLVWSRTLPGIAIRESSPMPINYDGGTVDVTFGARDGKLYVLNGDSGNDKTNWPQQTSNPIDATPSSADVDSDGQTDIFISSGVSDQGECSGGGLYRFAQNGVKKFEFNAIDDAGQSSIQCADPALHSSPVLGDINKDGATDIAFGALGLKNWNLRYDGAINSGWPFYWDDTQFASSALADVNGDGKTDVVIAGDSSPGAPVDHRGGMVRAFDGNGTQLWEYRVNEIVRSSPSIGDVDGDGNLDVVFGTGNYWVAHGGASDATKVFVLNASNGVLKWSKDLSAQTMASPTLADFTGDGRLDIGIATWQGSDPGKLWLLDGVAGTNVPNFPVASGGGIVLGQVATTDLNADGRQDPIVTTGGAVFAYDSATGGQLWGLRQGVASYQNTPLVTDMDSDGRLDIVIAGTKPNGEAIIDRYEFPNGDPAVLGTNGWHMFRKDQRLTGSWATTPLSDVPSGNAGEGYRIFTSSGGAYQYGSSPFAGSLSGISLAKPIVGGSVKPSSNSGYWMVASDGGIFSFGDAGFYGSTGNIVLNKPIVGMASTPSGNGYWMVASDGGIFSFGDAGFYGSTGSITLNKPIVGMTDTGSGNGYWMVASDGGIFAFGDAPFHGSTGNLTLVKPIVGISRGPGNGYWMVASDGGIFSFNAAFHGSAANTYGISVVNIGTQGGY